ncbi:hypothetical protein FS837_000765, partial [Tulasnella sp. UAMH 9824]
MISLFKKEKSLFAWVISGTSTFTPELLSPGRDGITLDLVNCTEVRNNPSPSHRSAQNDIGSITAREQRGAPGSENLVALLCPFQMIYGDGVERLAAESAGERVRWVGAIRDALSRETTISSQSARASSPSLSLRSTPSIYSLRSDRTTRTSRRSSTEGSRSTTVLPPQSGTPIIGSPSISPESFTGSASSVPGPRPRTSTLASGSTSGPHTETRSVLSPRSTIDTQSSMNSRSETKSQSSPSSRFGTGSRSVVSSRSGTGPQSAVSGSSRSIDSRSPVTQTSGTSGAPVTQSKDLRSSSSVTSDSITEGRIPAIRSGPSHTPSAFSGPRSATTSLSPTFTRTGTSTKSSDGSALSSGAGSFASESRSIPSSRSSSLRRTNSSAHSERVFEPSSPSYESGSTVSSVGTLPGGHEGAIRGAATDLGASSGFRPPPAPPQRRDRSSRGPRRPTTPSSYESSSQSASSSEIFRIAPMT